MTWGVLERALGQEQAKNHRRGQGWGRADFGGEGWAGRGWGTGWVRGQRRLGWGMESHESRPCEFPRAQRLDVQPKITCWSPG